MLGKFTEVVPPLQGGDAAAIVGGIAALVLFAAAASTDGGGFLETTSDHLVDGLVFAFKAMGVVLPIAGFFFIGNATSPVRFSVFRTAPLHLRSCSIS